MDAAVQEADLVHRISLAAEGGLGIDLTGEDVAVLQACGAWGLLEEAAQFIEGRTSFPPVGLSCPNCDPSIYFIQEGEKGPIKIGLAKDPRDRMIGLQTGHAARLRLLAAVRGDLLQERRFHAFYAREHISGEWFRPSPRLLAFLAELQRIAA